MTDILTKRGNLDIDMCTGTMSCEGWDMRSQDGHQKLVGGRKRLSLRDLRENQLCQFCDPELLPSRTLRKCISVF